MGPNSKAKAQENLPKFGKNIPKQAFVVSDVTKKSGSGKNRSRMVVFLEVTLQQAFQTTAVAGFVMNYSKKPLKIQVFFT